MSIKIYTVFDFEYKHEMEILQLKTTSLYKEKTPNLTKMKLLAFYCIRRAKNHQNSKIFQNSKNMEKILQN